MDVSQNLKSLLSNYRRDSFYIDQHALERLKHHHNIDIWDVLHLLSSRKFERVEKNDSAKPVLERYESFKVFIPVSTKYKYCSVIYLLEEKHLVETVYNLDKTAQEAVEDE